MKKLLMRWAANAVSLWIVAMLFSGVVFYDGTSLMLTALALTLLNAFLKPVLKFLSFPLTLLTLGLFSLVINGIVLMMAFSYTSGSLIRDLPTAILVSVMLSLINSLFDTKEDD